MFSGDEFHILFAGEPPYPFSIGGPITTTHATPPPLPPQPLPVLEAGAREALEHPARRAMFFVLALIVLGMFFHFTHSFWVPAHPGVDQNGYLVGGKMILDHGSTSIIPVNPLNNEYDPFRFVGNMWVGSGEPPNERYFPKYPLGLPLLVALMFKISGVNLAAINPYTWTYVINPISFAIALWMLILLWRLSNTIIEKLVVIVGAVVFGLLAFSDLQRHPSTVMCMLVGTYLLVRWWKDGRGSQIVWSLAFIGSALLNMFGVKRIGLEGWELTYYISPVSMTISVWMVFLITRRIAGSFAGVMAMITMAINPCTLLLCNNPNSHASTVMCVTVGMYLMMCWWEVGGGWRALLAGLFIGYAATIRYTEALLGAAVLAAALMNLRPRSIRSWLETGLLCFGWVIPVLGLAVFNLKEMKSWTGYDPTNESSGFAWKYFEDNWEPMIRQVIDNGLYFVGPIGVSGLLYMLCSKRWKLGIVFFLWIFPTLGIYSFYYWAPDDNRIGYLRFFLTIFPAIIICAFWLIAHIERASRLIRVIAALSPTLRPAIASAVIAGAVVSMALLQSSEFVRQDMANQQHQELQLYAATTRILRKIPPGSVVFVENLDRIRNFANHLQFAGDYQLYNSDVFRGGGGGGPPRRDGANAASDEPVLIDRARSQAIRKYIADTKGELTAIDVQRKIITTALAQNKGVFFIASRQADPYLSHTQWIQQAGYIPSSIPGLITPPRRRGATTNPVVPEMVAQVVGYWRLMLPPPPVDERPSVQGRWGMRGGANFFGNDRNNRTQAWQIIQITYPEPPATQPSVTTTK